jgi:hypothetical protein
MLSRPTVLVAITGLPGAIARVLAFTIALSVPLLFG